MKKNNILLTKRDEYLLTFLHIVKVASRKQISDEVYKGSLEQNVRRRLKQLKDNELIKRSRSLDIKDKSYLYSLTNKGFKLVKNNSSISIVNNRFKSDSIEHDLGLVDIKSIIEKMSMVERYYCENQIQSYAFFDENRQLKPFKDLMFDGFLLMKNNEGLSINHAIQFERQQKTESRYKKIITDYYIEKSIKYIFYICTDKAIENMIKKVEMKISKEHNKKLYFIQQENLINCNRKLSFINQDSKIIEIN